MKKKIILSIILAVVAALLVVYHAFPGAVSGLLQKMEHGRAGLSMKTLKAGDFNIAYCSRDGKGETIVMIHGYGANKDHWTRMSAAIPGGFRLVIPDLPGFGDSSKLGDRSYDIMSQVERLKDFADAAGLERFHLVGNSMGGNVAARFAAEHPERVITLCLIDTGGVSGAKKSDVMKKIESGDNPLLLNNVDDFDRFMALGTYHRPYIPGVLKRHFAEEGLRNRPFYEKIMRDLNAKPAPVDSIMMRISAPTLVLWGDHDRILDVSAVTVLKAGIPVNRAVVMKDCGHAPMIEYPAETAGLLVGFIRANKK